MNHERSGPVFLKELYRAEHLRLENQVNDSLAAPHARFVESASAVLAAQLREAYSSGLRDGFIQGVTAARDRDDGEEQ